MSVTPRTWSPTPSTGVAVGAAISLLMLACVMVVVVAGAATSSTPTRIVCTAGAVVGIAILVVSLVGTWWCSTLRYVLDAAALEIRFGPHVSRVRYDEIEGIAARRELATSTPTLWPGAYFGRFSSPSGQTEVWRATTRDPRSPVVVAGMGTSTILTPAEPVSIRAQLIERARQAAYADPRNAAGEGTWLDPVTALDGWIRALVFGAIVIASIGVGVDVARFGAAQADGISAATILLANGAAAFAVSGRWPLVARLLAAGALAGQLIALAW